MSDIFLQMHIAEMQTHGFWGEFSKGQMIHRLESTYNNEILMKWHISDVVPHGEKFLIKWRPNGMELTLEQVKEKYRNSN